ncbi:hypothetical protein O9993_08455 [Vibrio lentus]|nr:hypothetical protein [Vibrio lentus]
MVSSVPGAYGGIKSFNGALDKITNRNPAKTILVTSKTVPA